jgi:hypothetical protein
MAWYDGSVHRRAIATLATIVACGPWGCSRSEPTGEEPTARTVAAEPAPPGTPPPAASPAGDPATPSAPAPPAPDTASPDPDPAVTPEPPPEATEPPPPATEPLQASVDDSVVFPDGHLLRVAADEGVDQSVIWAQSITPAGPAVVLRKTSGAVDAIAATFDGETLWVAWRSHMDDQGTKSMAALAGFDRDLKLTRSPRILRAFDHDGSPMQEMLLLEPRPGTGAGVTVAAAVGIAPCRGLFPHEPEDGPSFCQRLQIDVVDPDGTTRRSAFRLLDGGDGSVSDLVDVGEGVVTSFYVWHGGPLLDVAFVPYAADEPVRELSPCGYPPVDLAWADGALLMVCPDPSGEGSCRGRAASPCGTLRRTTLKGEPLAPDAGTEVRFHRVTQGCKDGEPTLRLSWVADRQQPAIAPGHLDVPAYMLGTLGGPSGGRPCRGPTLE